MKVKHILEDLSKLDPEFDITIATVRSGTNDGKTYVEVVPKAVRLICKKDEDKIVMFADEDNAKALEVLKDATGAYT